MALKAITPAMAVRPKMESKWLSDSARLIEMLSANFSFSTILCVGALIQGTLLILIPRLWVLLPTIAVLTFRLARTYAITYKLIPNPQLEGAIHAKYTAVIPDTDGEFNKAGNAAEEKIAVLILGLRINHPLGFLESSIQKIGEFNDKMMNDLDSQAPDNGFLGQSQFSSKTASGSQDQILISYWRSIEDVLKFSVGPSHQETWNWWESHAPELKHVGISHELFEAPRSMYESVYLNFQPTRLGATTFFKRGDETIGGTVPDTWIHPLVDASRGKFRNSKGRLGWSTEQERETVMEKQGLYY